MTAGGLTTTVTGVEWVDTVVRRRHGPTIGPATMSARPGRVLGLVGGNGAGKTTLLKAACGLVALSEGRVLVGSETVRPGRRPEGLGAMIEEPAFLPRASARANLRLAAAGRPDWLARLVPALDQVDLTSRGGDRVGEFSQGMRQRLGIARVLIGDPPVVILDEPTNGLDPQGIRWIRDLVRRLADEGRTVVLSSHLLAEVQVLADDIAVIAQGAVAAYGPAAEVLRADVTLEQFYFETLARTTPSTPVRPAE